jgi:hypothetical protein
LHAAAIRPVFDVIRGVPNRRVRLDLMEGIGDLLLGEFRALPSKPPAYASFDLPSFSGETSTGARARSRLAHGSTRLWCAHPTWSHSEAVS